jgi:hypothetical protein
MNWHPKVNKLREFEEADKIVERFINQDRKTEGADLFSKINSSPCRVSTMLFVDVFSTARGQNQWQLRLRTV